MKSTLMTKKTDFLKLCRVIVVVVPLFLFLPSPVISTQRHMVECRKRRRLLLIYLVNVTELEEKSISIFISHSLRHISRTVVRKKHVTTTTTTTTTADVVKTKTIISFLEKKRKIIKRNIKKWELTKNAARFWHQEMMIMKKIPNWKIVSVFLPRFKNNTRSDLDIVKRTKIQFFEKKWKKNKKVFIIFLLID